MTPWQYIWAGLGLLVLIGALVGAGLAEGAPVLAWSVLPAILILIGVVGQGVKIGLDGDGDADAD